MDSSTKGSNQMSQVIIYSRVSDSNKANQDSQVIACDEYAAKNNLIVTTYVNENISASKTTLNDRKLSTVIAGLGKGDILIMSDITRLGREDVMPLIGAISNITQVGAELHLAYNDSFINKANSSNAEIIFTVVGQSYAAVEESKRRSERAIAGHKKSTLSGRRKGTTNRAHKLDKHNAQVAKVVSEKGNLSALARELEVSRNTLNMHIKRRGFKAA